MTTDKLNVNNSQEESTASTTKRVWVKPTLEVISVETGTHNGALERTIANTYKSYFHS